MYENYCNNEHIRLEYVGRFQNTEGYVVLASGSREVKNHRDKQEYQHITILFQIDRRGNCIKSCECDFSISSANSMVVKGDYVYFGQNNYLFKYTVKRDSFLY